MKCRSGAPSPVSPGEPITPKDLRACKLRIARAEKLAAKKEREWTAAIGALAMEKSRHSRLIERYIQNFCVRRTP